MKRSIPPTLRAATPDLPAVPPLVQFLVAVWFESLFTWFNTLVLRLVLQRCASHPLVLLAQRYDPAPCGFAGLADVIAARNISRRAVVNHPYYPDDEQSVTPG